MTHTKVLFILKKKKLYDTPYDGRAIHSGLFNSALFVNNMLNSIGIESNLVQVNDNNDIDREVTKYKPTHVIIEAIWVIPSKFEILHKLHPNVKWIIRLHSEMPFISNEGHAIEWAFNYDKIANHYNIILAPNTIKMYGDLKKVGIKNLVYLPNYYPVIENKRKILIKDHIDIGCFGAIRPMKNQLIQAVAAINFGNEINRTIYFHINSERIEKGDTALKNIRALFDNQSRHKLVEHKWYTHQEFKALISRMDLGLQVSFNETFNIVAADMVSEGVPVVGSDEIIWLNSLYKAKTTSSDDITKKLKRAYFLDIFNFQVLNKWGLSKTSKKAICNWRKYFQHW